MIDDMFGHMFGDLIGELIGGSSGAGDVVVAPGPEISDPKLVRLRCSGTERQKKS